jgi:hypothetical protein
MKPTLDSPGGLGKFSDHPHTGAGDNNKPSLAGRGLHACNLGYAVLQNPVKPASPVGFRVLCGYLFIPVSVCLGVLCC